MKKIIAYSLFLILIPSYVNAAKPCWEEQKMETASYVVGEVKEIKALPKNANYNYYSKYFSAVIDIENIRLGHNIEQSEQDNFGVAEELKKIIERDEINITFGQGGVIFGHNDARYLKGERIKAYLEKDPKTNDIYTQVGHCGKETLVQTSFFVRFLNSGYLFYFLFLR